MVTTKALVTLMNLVFTATHKKQTAQIKVIQAGIFERACSKTLYTLADFLTH